MTVPYTLTHESALVVLNGKTYTSKRGDENFEKVRAAILAERWDEIPPLVSKGLAIQRWSQGHFQFSDNWVEYKGKRIPQELNERMLMMAKKGEDPAFLMLFYEKLQKNPSWRSVQSVFRFLNQTGIPIGKDGRIYGYKSVRPHSFLDWHAGKHVNKPGSTVEEPRNEISDDPDQDCHFGLHVGNLQYAQTFNGGGLVVIVAIDPADVVCVPRSQIGKLRCCRYEVIGIHGSVLPDTSVAETELENVDVTAPPVTEVEEEILDTDEDTGETERSEEVSPVKARVLADLDEAPAPAPAAPEKPPGLAPPVGMKLRKLGDYTLEELLTWTLDDLRHYATYVLHIVRASKIPGGKQALAGRIIQVRTVTKTEEKE